ncbi:MAG: M23 family metallopeptidase [Rickettsiales bacterium]|jgi:murein DD-endopeptidase MepM/ murein hydrolase activator NlpD|nr:M23 family metallopeptidase [Rickettsiales bacterium]
MKKKKMFAILFLLAVLSCSQDPARVTIRENNSEIRRINSLKPSYMKGEYVRTKDNRTVRDLSRTPDRSPTDEDEDSEHAGDTTLGSRHSFPTGNFKIVVVQRGDSLIKIATNYDLSLSKLAKFNGIESPYNIYVGQKIRIPVAGGHATVSQREKRLLYTVKPGDNLYRVAYENNVKFTDLIRDNNLKKPYDLQVGQKLFLEPEKSPDSSQAVIHSRGRATSDGQKLVRVKDNGGEMENNISGREPQNRAASDLIWPVDEGKIIKTFGKQPDGSSNDSIGIKAPLKTKIKSIADGEVAYTGDEIKGFGKIVIVKHSGGWISVYGHCESINVKNGDTVQKGQIIGTVGDTGNVSEPQLYFSLRKGKVAVDPTKYLSRR